MRDLLTELATPTAMLRAGDDAVNQLIARRSPRLAKQLTPRIAKALEAQSLALPGEDTWGEVITGLIADLERIVEQRGMLGEQIEEAFLAHPLGQVLVTLCGFGPRTGSRTLAEIGDPHRFANGGRLAAYAGLAPVDRRSGKSINNAAASRRGNHRLKNAMFLAAFVAVRHDTNAKAYYDRKRAEGKGHNAAVICVARRRCDLVLAMLTTGQAYTPNRQANLPSAA